MGNLITISTEKLALWEGGQHCNCTPNCLIYLVATVIFYCLIRLCKIFFDWLSRRNQTRGRNLRHRPRLAHLTGFNMAICLGIALLVLLFNEVSWDYLARAASAFWAKIDTYMKKFHLALELFDIVNSEKVFITNFFGEKYKKLCGKCDCVENDFFNNKILTKFIIKFLVFVKKKRL